MHRPYVICHMVTSLDGKVTGDFLYRPECEAATEIYYEINREYKEQGSGGFICGRVTMEQSFTGGYYPDLSRYEPIAHDPCPMNYWVDDMTGYYTIRGSNFGWFEMSFLPITSRYSLGI